MTNIVETVVSRSDIRLRLSNDVFVNIACNEDYLHLSFSNIDGDHMLYATGYRYEPSAKTLKLANYVDIVYKPKEV